MGYNLKILLFSLLTFSAVMVIYGLQEEDSIKCNRLQATTNCRKWKQTPSDKTTIYFGLMLSFPDPQGRPSFNSSFEDGHNIAPAVYLAVKQVNNQTDLLKDYEIEILRLDSGCNILPRTTTSINELICGCQSVVGIIGPSCEGSSKTVNQFTNREDFSLITINYGGQNAGTGNYSYAFGILGTLKSLYSTALAELLKHNNWTNYAMLYTAEYSDISRDIIFISGFQPQYTSLLYQDTFIPLKTVKKSYSRVIVVLANPSTIARVLCLAHYEGMFLPDYQWIFHEIIQQNFAKTSFTYQGMPYVCDGFNFSISVNGSINLFLNALQDGSNIDEDREDEYYILDNYYEGYKLETVEYSKEFGVNSTTTEWARGFYDAVWALAYALNGSLADLNTSLSKFKLGSPILAESIRKHMLNLDFCGITGNIKFDNNTGFNEGDFLNVIQYDEHQKPRKIGTFKDGKLNITSLNSSAYFIDSLFKQKLDEINDIVMSGILIFTLITLILLISAQIINIRYRNHKGIKASSPMLNHLIFIGGYMIAIGVMIYAVETPLWVHYPVIGQHICSLAPSLFSIGVTLCLGTVCIKTWRLNRIYIHSKRFDMGDIKSIKGYRLLGFLITLVVTDVLVCILWRSVDSQSPKVTSEENIIIGDRGERVVLIEQVCHSDYEVYWYAALLAPKLLLVLASLILALLTQMNIKEFKTGNVIVLSFFLTAIFGLGIPIYAIIIVTFRSNVSINISTAVLSTCLNLTTCIGVCILLQPLWKFKCKSYVHMP